MNLFINSLKEEDRGKELEFMRPQNAEDLIKNEHHEFMTEEISGGQVAVKGKINKICDALKEELWKHNQDNKYLLPILTTYIKKQP